MINYLITVDTVTNGVITPLVIYKTGDDVLTSAKLTEEINDGMFDGSFEFEMLPGCAGYDTVRMMISTIRVVEIDDNGQWERFRGRPISITTDLYGRRKVVCENDLKFLIDVPDMFSKIHKSKTVYYLGSEDTWHIPALSENDNPDHSAHWMYGEALSDNTNGHGDPNDMTPSALRQKYEIYTNNVVKKPTDDAPPGKMVGPLYWDCGISGDDMGAVFTVYWDGDVYQLPLRKYRFVTQPDWNMGDAYTYVDMFYLGNIRVPFYSFRSYFQRVKVTIRAVWQTNPSVVSEAHCWPPTVTQREKNQFQTVMYMNWYKAQKWLKLNDDDYLNSTYGEGGWYESEGGPTETVIDDCYEEPTFVCEAMHSTAPAVDGEDYDPTIVEPISDDFISRYDNIHVQATLRKEINGEMVDVVTSVKLSDVPFCICNFCPDYIISFVKSWTHNTTIVYARNTTDQSEYTGATKDGSEVTLMYPPKYVADAIAEYPDHYEPLVGYKFYYPYVLAYKTSTIDIFTMYAAIFTDYGNRTRGYNKFAMPGREIWRGVVDVSGDVENSSIDTIYSHLRDWLSETGGYAKIRNENGIYYLDLLAAPGVVSEDFSVVFGDNIVDCEKLLDANDVHTGIYVVATYPVSESENADEKRVNITQAAAITGEEIEVGTGYTYADGVIWNDAARASYGDIIASLEINKSTTTPKNLVEEMIKQGKEELGHQLSAALTFEIGAVDRRLIHKTGARPVLGNSYPVVVQPWGISVYERLSAITTDLLNPDKSKLTFGDKQMILSDYVARKGERL